MKKRILLTRHRHTEKYGTSLWRLYRSIDDILVAHYEVVRLDPMYRYFTREEQEKEIQRLLGKGVDVALISHNSVLPELRRAGWEGCSLVMGLGSLPRGATSLRQILTDFRQNDAVLLSSTADVHIWTWFLNEGPEAVLLPFGVDTNLFRPYPVSDIEALRQNLGFSIDDKIILYSGRITIEKNVHSILPIFAELVRRHPNYQLLIVGSFENIPFREFGIEADIKQKIHEMTLDLGIHEHVRFLPHLDTPELVRIYNLADVFVNFTLHHDENFGFTQVEAMACGTPVIGTEWGGLKDTIAHGRTGYLLPTWHTSSGIRFDSYQAAVYLEQMLENNLLRAKLGSNARDWVQTQFSMDVFARRLLYVIAQSQEPKVCPRLRLSSQGFKFNFRFSNKVVEGVKVEFSPKAPTYSEYNDSDYRNLLQHYVSERPPNWHGESVLTCGPYWHLVDNPEVVGQTHKLENQDPMWPMDVAISAEQKNQWEYILAEAPVTVNRFLQRFGIESKSDLEALLNLGVLICSNVVPSVNYISISGAINGC